MAAWVFRSNAETRNLAGNFFEEVRNSPKNGLNSPGQLANTI